MEAQKEDRPDTDRWGADRDYRPDPTRPRPPLGSAVLVVLAIAVLVPIIRVAIQAQQDPAVRRHAEGRAEAERDIKNGVLKLKTYSLPGPWRGEYSTWLKQQYGVELEGVAHCVLTGDAKDCVKGYNERVNAELATRFGGTDFTALSRDAWTAHVERLPPLPLRTDPPPKAWKANQINDGLPYRWEKGIVHLLAWEVIGDDGPWQVTQILVLKRFDQPTEKGGHGWVLAQVFYYPNDGTWPWHGAMRIPNPSPHMPEMTHAQLFGSEFYDDPPTDAQIKAFLNETSWTQFLGTHEDIFLYGKRIFTTKLTAGGIDWALWMMLFDRDVPTNLFPELKKASHDKK